MSLGGFGFIFLSLVLTSCADLAALREAAEGRRHLRRCELEQAEASFAKAQSHRPNDEDLQFAATLSQLFKHLNDKRYLPLRQALALQTHSQWLFAKDGFFKVLAERGSWHELGRSLALTAIHCEKLWFQCIDPNLSLERVQRELEALLSELAPLAGSLAKFADKHDNAIQIKDFCGVDELYIHPSDIYLLAGSIHLLYALALKLASYQLDWPVIDFVRLFSRQALSAAEIEVAEKKLFF